jgi:hypothetical protein
VSIARVKIDEARPAAAAARGQLIAYCIALGVTPFLLLFLAFAIAPTDWAVRHTGNSYLLNIGYAAKLEDADCQVVIYGDSSAMVGLDPAVIHERTGLSTCNIAEFAGMSMVNGMMIPDLYLRHNPSPKVWVFDFAPENLAVYKEWQTVSLYEAILFRVRERRDLSTLSLLLAHPKEAIEFAGLGLRLALLGLAKQMLPNSTAEIRSAHRGWFPTPGEGLKECSPERREHPADPEYIRDIRSRYGADGAAVIVDSTPEPACDPTFQFYAIRHPAPTDNQIEAYPVSDFNGSGRLHMTSAGVAKFSNAVSDQIIETLKRQAASLSEPEAR